MSRPIFVLDMDGCIASQGKLWSDFTPTAADFNINPAAPAAFKELSVQKIISDHDSWAIDTLKKKSDIVILSGDDRINEAWAKRRGVEFIFTAARGFHSDKWEHLVAWFVEKYGDIDKMRSPGYFYLGDSMPDFKCMENAQMAFCPRDACTILKRKLGRTKNGFYELTRDSGCGVFEEMVNTLILYGHLNDGMLK